ncbi:hypothetical protein Cgig2_010712 [Carnegiea gigantea]|uniref:Uncharacterized protein n=1 Tax=Carnegiea gigantea TaxID=171969 RepID=A0A9Q1KKT4_9CARY|nr:hypothetical protein Cgig2_010712 [Carnegiea gigantea]
MWNWPSVQERLEAYMFKVWWSWTHKENMQASNADRAPPVDHGLSTIEASPSQFQQTSATFSQEAATASPTIVSQDSGPSSPPLCQMSTTTNITSQGATTLMPPTSTRQKLLRRRMFYTSNNILCAAAPGQDIVRASCKNSLYRIGKNRKNQTISGEYENYWHKLFVIERGI